MAAPAARSAHLEPRVLLLATGGTIAGQAASRHVGGYRAHGLDVASLVSAAPGLATLASLAAEQVASVGSQDMVSAVWRALQDRILLAFAQDRADAVVISHGTDTLEETAFLLDLLVAPGPPVVLVGAMRPADAVGADGPANLLQAVRVAADPAARGRGGLVVLDGQIHAATRVYKGHAAIHAAFCSTEGGPLGVVTPAAVRFFAPPAAPALAGRYRWPAEPGWPRVEVLYAHADMEAASVAALAGSGLDGVILAGVGSGNASAVTLEILAAAARRGVAVVRASRIDGGRVDRNVEVDDDGLGLVAAGMLNPQKSRLLLSLLLASGVRRPPDLQQAFDAV